MDAGDLYEEKRPISCLIEAVCVRPQMYTVNGTLEEACAFLNGFHSGVAQNNPYDEIIDQWAKFCRWACEQLDTKDGWYGLARALRLEYSDDENAFAKLAALCIEYQSEFGRLVK